MESKGVKVAAKNQKAFHDYFVEERFEAGLVLTGITSREQAEQARGEYRPRLVFESV